MPRFGRRRAVRAYTSTCVMGSSPQGRNGKAGSSVADEPGPKGDAKLPRQRTCSTVRLPWGNGARIALSGRVRSSHACQSLRSKTTTWQLWIGATSAPGSVVRSVKLSGASPCADRHNPAKQNQSSPVLVNRHLDFGDSVPVNSKKCEAGTRQRPLAKRRPSERKLMTGGAFGRPAGNPQRNCASSTPSAWRRTMGAISVGQISSRGSKFGGVVGRISGRRRWLNSST